MATATSIFRLKASRKFGIPFWPWRRLNPKQAKIVAKVSRKLNRQAKNQEMKRKKSQFFYQIRAKKLITLLYGKLNTSYLLALFKKSTALKGNTMTTFFSALEARVDTILYRLQFAPTLQAARQLISHKKVCVNNTIINKSGYILEPGDVISITPDAVSYVGHNIQHFLRADNTHTGYNSVGLLQKFRPKRRKKSSFFRKRIATPAPKRSRELVRRFKTQEQLRIVRKLRAQKNKTVKKTTLTPTMRAKMQLKMRVLLMQAKRHVRFHVRLKNTIERNLRIRRPKASALRLRFQRTATGMPVKTWLTQVIKDTHTWQKENTRIAAAPKSTSVAGIRLEAKRALRKTSARTQMQATHTTKGWQKHPTPPKHMPWQEHTRKGRKKHPFRFVTRKVFYKPTHVEVNYHTLHIVFLFPPQHIYYPVKLDVHHIAGAFQR